VTDDTRYRDPTMPFKTYVNLSVYMLRVLASLFNTCIVLYVPSPSVHSHKTFKQSNHPTNLSLISMSFSLAARCCRS
jgi:hypothetical protein